MTDTDMSVREQFEELASFEGPDCYWSIEVIHNPQDDTYTVWVCNENGPQDCLAKGVGRFFSYEKSWKDCEVDSDT